MEKEREETSPKVRNEALVEAKQYLSNGNNVYVYGEKGIGKSVFLSHLEGELSCQTVSVQARSEESFENLRGRILTQAFQWCGKPGKPQQESTSKSLGFGLTDIIPFKLGKSSEKTYDVEQEGRLQQVLKEEEIRLVVFIQDGYNLSLDEENLLEQLKNLSSNIGVSFQVVIEIYKEHAFVEGGWKAVKLGTFDEEKTRKWVNQAYDLETDDYTAKLYKKTHGQPTYLRMAAEISIEQNKTLEFRSQDDSLDKIAHEYIRSLSMEEREFLEAVSVLPALHPGACAQITDKSSANEAQDQLERLTHRGIVTRDNFDEYSQPVYQINTVLRNHLKKRSRGNGSSPKERHKKVLQYHIQQLHNHIVADPQETPGNIQKRIYEFSGVNHEDIEESSVVARKATNTLPHLIAIQHHLGKAKEPEYTPQDFLDEFNQCNITYPERLVTIIYLGIALFRQDAAKLFKEELPRFEQESADVFEKEWQVALITNSLRLALDQALSHESDESQSVDDIDNIISEEESLIEKAQLSDQEAIQLLVELHEALIMENPREFETAIKHMSNKTEHVYGISPSILSSFLQYLLDALQEKKEVPEVFGKHRETIKKRVYRYLRGNSISQYELVEIMGRNANGVITSIRADIFEDEKFLREIGTEGGDILEQADNPVFALLWFSYISGLIKRYNEEQDQQPFEQKIRQLATRRHKYEQNLDKSVIEVNEDFIDF